ncbi:MAG: choice-of-anchor tandem repeat GloVer-containing protein [Candidatus Cybelea sp.]
MFFLTSIPVPKVTSRSGVILDGSGNLYGTTELGGDLGCPNNQTGCGNVFALSPGGSETTVALSPKQGYHPVAGLVSDAKGNLYGTTRDGGDLKACVGYGGCGSVFEITR